MIRINNLSFGYEKNSHLVFENLSMELEENKVYGLMGQNGTGKSTLLYLISGLLFAGKDTVVVDGLDATRREPTFLGEIFLVPDEFTFPKMTLRGYVQTYAPFYPHFSQELLSACLQEFALSDTERLDKLSLGQRKKAYISFAIATRTRVLMMDEPTNGLDIPSKSIFRKLIARHMDEGQTLIISTHQVHDIESMIDHVLIVRENGTLYSRAVSDITSEYSFDNCPLNYTEGVVYSEPSPQGHAVMTHHQSGVESTVNLELFFNAVNKGVI